MTKPNPPGTLVPSSTGNGMKRFNATNWRTKVQMARVKMDDPTKELFLEHYAEFNRKSDAAHHAGVSWHTYKLQRKEDAEFGRACEACEQHYRDKVAGVVHDWVMSGVTKKSYNRDGEIIFEQHEPSVKLIELEARRIDESYRDNRHVDVAVSQGGVLVAPAAITPNEWVKEVEKSNTDKPSPFQIEGKEMAADIVPE